MRTNTFATGLLALSLAAGAAGALAQGRPEGPGYGPGGGWGPGMMGGYGGPSMMGGYGGPGMMGGGGPGWGGSGFGALNLTDEQREKIAVVQEKNRSRNWETMGQLRSEQFKLRQMAYSDRIDPAAFTEQQKKVDELRRTMLRARVESRNEIDAILTPEQRKQFRQFGPWWLQNGNVE